MSDPESVIQGGICSQYSSQVVLVSYRLRVIQRIIRTCLEEESKNGLLSASPSLYVNNAECRHPDN